MFIPFTLIMVLTTCRRLWLLSLSGRVPMRHLVYRVQPLPQSMLPLVWDFGQLNTCVEELYIHQMVRRFVSEYSSADCNSFFWFVFFPPSTDLLLVRQYTNHVMPQLCCSLICFRCTKESWVTWMIMKSTFCVRFWSSVRNSWEQDRYLLLMSCYLCRCNDFMLMAGDVLHDAYS